MDAYLENIRSKTGKTLTDFRQLAGEQGLTTRAELMLWLKTAYGLGHGHATALVHQILQADAVPTSPEAQIAALFAGKKARWRAAYDALLAAVTDFGPDVTVAPTKSYVSLLRRNKKFAIAQPATPDRFDLGIKLKGVAPAGRLEAAGAWNAMVTHRVQISDPAEIDDEVRAWLRQAYAAA